MRPALATCEARTADTDDSDIGYSLALLRKATAALSNTREWWTYLGINHHGGRVRQRHSLEDAATEAQWLLSCRQLATHTSQARLQSVVAGLGVVWHDAKHSRCGSLATTPSTNWGKGGQQDLDRRWAVRPVPCRAEEATALNLGSDAAPMDAVGGTM